MARTGRPTFHAGERSLHARFGLDDKMALLGSRMIRDAMPEQHRDFYRLLPFLVVGSVDRDGRPWASMVSGQPGFLDPVDETRLWVGALPCPGDPLGDNLAEGVPVGALGLEFHSRRRNRLNGKVALAAGGGGREGFAIAVDQSFGNCPKYIQARTWRPAPDRTAGPPAPGGALDAHDRRLIEAADTFFIASAFGDDPADRAHGVDASHRGGKPGFVQAPDERTLVFPDYTGNFMFNTLGNLVGNPKSGLLFLDFETGDTLQLTGEAEIVWDEAALTALGAEARPGAQRYVRFRVARRLRIRAAVPLAWDFAEYSPYLERL